MKYHFVAKVYDLKIDNSLSKGIKIDNNARISNGALNFRRLFDNDIFMNSVGFLETKALIGSTYVYEVGEYNNLNQVFNDDQIPSVYLNYLMRKVQVFINALWLVKDNSVNMELGFLHVYPKERPNEGSVHSNSISATPTNCFGEYSETTFTREELDRAIRFYNIMLSEEWNHNEAGERLPSRNPLTKENGRMGRAFYFLLLARDESVLPIKTMNYCSVLECLFTSDSSEVTHKIAERFARFMARDFEQRRSYFKLVKDLYKIRSKAVHGQVVRESPEMMKDLLFEIDLAIRSIFIGLFTKEEKYSVFNLTNEEYEKWFNDLILK